MQLGMDTGADENVSKLSNLTGSLNESDTDKFSISGCSSLPSSQNTPSILKGDMQKPSDISNTSSGGAVPLSSDDRALYRQHRIRKIQSILKQCIKQKIAFREEYVEMSKQFLKDPSSMTTDDIEVLNIKCAQALAGEMSSPEKSNESDNEQSDHSVQSLLSRKKTTSSKAHASYHQNWLTGPGRNPRHSQQQHLTTLDYFPVKHSVQQKAVSDNYYNATQMAPNGNYGTLPHFSQFTTTSAVPLQQSMHYQQSVTQQNPLFGSQNFGTHVPLNFSQKSTVMPNTFGQSLHTPTIPLPPDYNMSTPIK